MHLLIITQYFPPETGALSSRWGDFSKILVKKNHNVTILCESPHYPNNFYYPGYKNEFFSISEEIPGLKVIRVKAYASDRKTNIKKLLHYFVFMISAILNVRKINKFDHLIISSPPLFTGVIGLFIKKFYKKKYWLDIRDLWPDSALQLDQIKEGFVYKMGKNLEKKIYHNSKGFIFPVPGFRNYFSKFSKETTGKPMVTLMNGVSTEFIKNAQESNMKRDENFTVLYSGNMGLAQDLTTIIKAAELLENYEIYFKFIGQGVCKSEIIKTAKTLNKVSFHDPMTRKELIDHINKSSVCLVPLKKKEIFNFALPSKMFEYMACKKPIIVGVNGEAKDLVKISKSGTHVSPEDPQMLSKAILNYFHNHGKILEHGSNGLSYITKNLEKEVLISNLIQKINSSFE